MSENQTHHKLSLSERLKKEGKTLGELTFKEVDELSPEDLKSLSLGELCYIAQCYACLTSKIRNELLKSSKKGDKNIK